MEREIWRRGRKKGGKGAGNGKREEGEEKKGGGWRVKWWKVVEKERFLGEERENVDEEGAGEKRGGISRE
jgi:hypothetical protein